MPVTVSPQANPTDSERNGSAGRAGRSGGAEAGVESRGAGDQGNHQDQVPEGRDERAKRRRVARDQEDDEEGQPADPAAQPPDADAQLPEGTDPDEEVRVPRTPPDPGRPTARERAEHGVLHYPYRSWCRHCVRGRGCSRHHKKRSAEDREFSKDRVPTLSVDHCFLGAEGEDDESTVTAHGNPFLILYDADSESLYCIPVATKAVTDWVVRCRGANRRAWIWSNQDCDHK